VLRPTDIPEVGVHAVGGHRELAHQRGQLPAQRRVVGLAVSGTKLRVKAKA
jgi:hypothetical protein